MKYLLTFALITILFIMSACGNITNGSTAAPTSTVTGAGTAVTGSTSAPTAPGGTTAPTAAGATATAAVASTNAPTVAGTGAATTTPVPAGSSPTPTRTPTRTPTAAATLAAAPTAIPVADAKRADPFTLLAAYFDAISHKDYGTAAKYHVPEGGGSPDPSIATKLAADYAGVSLVIPVVDPIVIYGAAAGSQYAPIPTFLIITQGNSTKRYAAGCETARRANSGNFDPPRDTGWVVYTETLTKTTSVDISQLAKVCEAGGPGGPLTDRSNPVNTLAALYDAINRKDFARGYSYWDSAPSGKTLVQWSAGYATTASVLVAVRPPLNTEGAAGSVYASLPSVLLSTDKDISKHAFYGCYTARRPNLPPSTDWKIYSGKLNNAPGNTASATLIPTITCP